jgi:hypothetical protein
MRLIQIADNGSPELTLQFGQFGQIVLSNVSLFPTFKNDDSASKRGRQTSRFINGNDGRGKT